MACNPSPLAAKLPFDPLMDLIVPGTSLQTDPLDILLTMDDRKRPTLHGFLASDLFSDNIDEIVAKFISEEDDPFQAPHLLKTKPEIDEYGTYRFSLIFALRAGDAVRLVKPRTLENIQKVIREDTFTSDAYRADFIPIGYGTITTVFRKTKDMVDEGEISIDDVDPFEYCLSVNPEAVFISKPYRGHQLGRMAGGGLAEPVISALSHLNGLSEALRIHTSLSLTTEYELHSEGGEAAIDAFHERLESFFDNLADDRRMFPKKLGAKAYGLSLNNLDKSGGW